MLTPTASLGEGRTAISISAGRIHTCALLDDGSVSCWGDNYDGQVGDNSTTNRYPRPRDSDSLGDGRTLVGSGETISSGSTDGIPAPFRRRLANVLVSCWSRTRMGIIDVGSDDESNNVPCNCVVQALEMGGQHSVTLSLTSGAHQIRAIHPTTTARMLSCWRETRMGNSRMGLMMNRNDPIKSISLGDTWEDFLHEITQFSADYHMVLRHGSTTARRMDSKASELGWRTWRRF